MIVRGPILLREDGEIRYLADGVVASDWIGEFSRFPGRERRDIRKADGVICPPFFDNHIHIPQHPIRGHFMDGVGADPEQGRLIAGLNRNVFPAEALCADPEYTKQCVAEFLRETRSKGVIGGCAYMTVHASAARIALEMLPATWSVGLVMMNQNCPEYLRTDEANFDRDAEGLARDFGDRYIVTDRFAIACDSPLRKRGVAIARKHRLTMQTHLNEQLKEKRFVEETLYPGETYTGVYERDGLLEPESIMAHCIHMKPPELLALERTRARIAHCPTSNTLLGSGIMPLDAVRDHGIDYAICTDVGASPTTSLLNEMAQFLKVHAGRSRYATPSEAMNRTTMNWGKPFANSFIEIGVNADVLAKCATADEVIAKAILEMTSSQGGEMKSALDVLATGCCDAGPEIDRLTDDVNATVRRLDDKVRRVTFDGKIVYEASTAKPR
jgi:guanine deaminase